MKRKIGLVLAVALVLAGLVGCAGGGLTDADFDLYDEDGKVVKKFEDSEDIHAEEGEFTSKKIKIGSTVQEFEDAYKDIIEKATIIGENRGDQVYHWIINDNILLIILTDGSVSSIRCISKRMDQSSEFSMAVDLLGRKQFDAEESASGDYVKWWKTLTDEEKEVINFLYQNNFVNAPTESWRTQSVFKPSTMVNIDNEAWLTDEQKKLAKSAYEKFKTNYDFLGY